MGITIKDVASRTGLSVSTVSKVFNHYADISEETRTLVLDTAKEIGYYPNATARALKTSRSYNLGFLFDEQASSGITHPFFAEVINAFKNESESRGFDITFINRNVGSSVMSYLDHCRYRNVDGVCLAGVDFFSREIHDLIYSNVPCVSIDHVFESHPSVVSENMKGIQMLTSYGISRGHRRIAYIHGENTSSVTRHRITGFYRTMSEHNLDVPESYVLEGKYLSDKQCCSLVLKLLDLPTPPTLILVPDDVSYLGAMEAAAQRHLVIGRDISFAGYDGILVPGG
ncbi:MAG: LacI family DNA-binding transcriptional regulator, partial [Clostridia bacterium]|nr:LacI family DNA-binding transcriptional regulator [Clostridia bacterium]